MATLTWSHHSFINSNRSSSLLGLIYTIILAVIFLICQYLEYTNSTFTISDGVYGTVFYAGTGLHGLHVMVGVIMLLVSAIRCYNMSLSTRHHLGFELSILYWHFVDVVWLFLYILYYGWGS